MAEEIKHCKYCWNPVQKIVYGEDVDKRTAGKGKRPDYIHVPGAKNQCNKSNLMADEVE